MDKNWPLIHVARAVADETIQLLERSPRGLVHAAQLRDAAQSIPANIREAMGRRRGREREHYLRIARSSAEETDEHLRANCAARRVPEVSYRRLHNRIAVIVRILNGMSGSDDTDP
jgi:four helix bundle protein